MEYAVQKSQLGTADAVLAASDLLMDWQGTFLVLVGDMPLVRSESIMEVRRLQADQSASLAMLTAISDDATGYGRVIRGDQGNVLGVVEERDASPEQRSIKEWNPSVYLFEANALWTSLKAVKPHNAQSEFYLTDTVQILTDSGAKVEAIPVQDALELMGVNTRVELARASEIMRRRINDGHMLAGVTIVDPVNTYIDADVKIGDTVILPGTVLTGNTTIGSECAIGPSATIHNSVIGNGSSIVSSQIVESTLEELVRVGPFANLSTWH